MLLIILNYFNNSEAEVFCSQSSYNVQKQICFECTISIFHIYMPQASYLRIYYSYLFLGLLLCRTLNYSRGNATIHAHLYSWLLTQWLAHSRYTSNVRWLSKETLPAYEDARESWQEPQVPGIETPSMVDLQREFFGLQGLMTNFALLSLAL